MALTRARVVAGPAALARDGRIGGAARVLTRPRDPARLVVDVDDMRRRIAEQHRAPGAFDFKHRRGGLVDIEFVAQYLAAARCRRAPELLRQNTQRGARGDRRLPARRRDATLAASAARCGATCRAC